MRRRVVRFAIPITILASCGADTDPEGTAGASSAKEVDARTDDAGELPGSYLDRFLFAYESLEQRRYDEAATFYESCLELAARNPTVAYHLACTSAQAGRTDDALMWLGRAVDWGFGDAAVMEWDPHLEPLKDDPRFGAVVQKASDAFDRGQADAKLIFEFDDRSLAPSDRYWLRDLEIGYRCVGSPVIHPDDRTALVPTGDGTLRQFDLESGERLRTLAGHRSEAFVEGCWSEIALHPDQDRLATFGSGELARVWSIESGGPLYALGLGPGPGVTHLAWSPDGELLAAGYSYGSVRLFDADTGAAVGEPMEHGGRVSHLAFDREGERLATGGADEFVRVWDVESGRLLAALELTGEFAFAVAVYEVAWTDAGDLVATAGSWATVGCFDGESLEPRWMVELADGNPATLHAAPNADVTRLYVSHTCVLDASNGAVLADVSDRDLIDLTPTRDDRLVLATRSGTVVLDGETFDERYTRTEWADDGELVHLPNLIHRGSRAALREARILIERDSYPLDSYAAHLLDPRRVLASAAGIEVRNPELPAAPRIDEAPRRNVRARGDEHVVTVLATDDSKVIGFQLERDGELLPVGVPGAALERSGKSATLSWTIDRRGWDETHLRIRAIGRSGVLSEPVPTAIRWR